MLGTGLEENGMNNARDIALIVGSLRKESLNRKMANAMIELAPAGLGLGIVEIGELAIYNDDVEKVGAPAPWTAFRERMRRVEGVIFVTPEYNRSMTAAIKNAIDVGSRPHGQSIWAGKPAAVVSVSPGNIGGFGANHHLRQSLVYIDMPVLQQPEMYIGGAARLFDESGRLSNDGTREYVGKFLQAYAAWVEKIAPRKA